MAPCDGEYRCYSTWEISTKCPYSRSAHNPLLPRPTAVDCMTRRGTSIFQLKSQARLRSAHCPDTDRFCILSIFMQSGFLGSRLNCARILLLRLLHAESVPKAESHFNLLHCASSQSGRPFSVPLGFGPSWEELHRELASTTDSL